MDDLHDEEHLTGAIDSPISPVTYVDPPTARFPQCIVWTPLPIISWLAPFVGHVGICRKDGVILDFAGPYFVNVDNFAFGATARFVCLSEQQCCFPVTLSEHICKSGLNHEQLGTALSWDDAIRSSMQQFQHRSYNLFTCNCHSFVANFLNKIAYQGFINWNIVTIVLLILQKGQWVGKMAIARSFAPFAVVMCLGLFLVGWPFLIGWAIFNVLLVGWFLLGTYLVSGLIG